MMFKTKERYTPNGEHCNIISPVLQLKVILPIETKVIHILGHQDEHLAFENLSKLEAMHIRMDAMAKYVVS